MSEDLNKTYDENYYDSYDNGQAYIHNNGWEEIFGKNAERIIKEISPKTVLDVGCAIGFFVEAFRDRGVEAYGIDVSEYAIKNVREDIKPYCKVQSATEKHDRKYDLVTCIEVFEHIEGEELAKAIETLCSASDDIIFSSTPFAYDDDTHISIHTPDYWAEQFAYNGFYHDVSYDCSFISVQAMRFRKAKKNTAELVREYEHEIFQKHQEVVALRHQLALSQDNVNIYRDAYQKHVDMINKELNPRILELEKKLEECEKEKILEFQNKFKAFEQEYEVKICELENINKKKLIENDEIWRLKLKEEVLKRKEFEELFYEYQKLYLVEKEKDKIKRKKINGIKKDCTKDYKSIHFFPIEANRIIKLRNRLWWRIWKNYKKEYSLDFWKPVFDAEFYSNTYDDLKETFGDDEEALFKHFITFGILEGRWAHKDFDVIAYLQANEDLRYAFKYNLPKYYIHYLRYGINEDRICKR